MEVCHLLEMGKVQKVQFVYHDVIAEYGENCEGLTYVKRVLRGAYEYPDLRNRREKPVQFALELSEWQKLPKKFNVQREEEDYCRGELWWAPGEVLAKKCPASMLRNNPPRAVITLTRRNE